MKKIILISLLLLATIVGNGQVWKGYGKGIGIGVDHWFDQEKESKFENINLSFVLSTFSESTLICPFASFGYKDSGKTYYKRKKVDNHIFLWEFGTSVLFEISDKLHIGPRLSAMHSYNKYVSFKDNWEYNVGIEIQFNLNSNYRSISNRSLYFNVNYRSIGIGYRYYLF